MNKVDDLLVCKTCKTNYVEAVIVPCYKKICSDCVDKHSVNGKFDCCFCKKMHEIPLDGFPLDDDLNELIKMKFERIYQNKHIKELSKLVQELETYSETIEIKEKGLENDLSEYCLSIRNQIDIATEETIEEINKIRENYLRIINDYEEKSLKQLYETKARINDYKFELDNYINEHREFLNDMNIDDDKSKEIYEKVLIKKKDIAEFVEKVYLLKFNDQKMEFTRNNIKINEKLIGEIKYSLININLEFESVDMNEKKQVETKDNITLISGSYDNTLKIWNIETGKCIRTLQRYTSYIKCVSVIDKSKIVSGCYDHTLKVWNKENGECIRILKGHTSNVWCVSVIDKSKIVSGSEDTTLKVWNIETGECIRTLQGHTNQIWCVSVIDKSKIVSGSWDSTLKLWNIETGECIRTFQGHTSYVNCVSVFDKSKILSGSREKTLKLWNIETGECIRTLEGHSYSVYCVSVIDKSKIVSGSEDKTLKVWNIETGECIRTLEGHSSSVYCLSVIDKSKIVSGSWDSTLKLWNIETGECIRTLQGHSSSVYYVSVVDK